MTNFRNGKQISGGQQLGMGWGPGAGRSEVDLFKKSNMRDICCDGIVQYLDYGGGYGYTNLQVIKWYITKYTHKNKYK